ncbi:hypothetical protein HDV05_002803 [Chytridiales sp. JEL 0842]|nr:hypothetical protein HDV05_002803 [Chytridiales sp. JEL 0842]
MRTFTAKRSFADSDDSSTAFHCLVVGSQGSSAAKKLKLDHESSLECSTALPPPAQIQNTQTTATATATPWTTAQYAHLWQTLQKLHYQRQQHQQTIRGGVAAPCGKADFVDAEKLCSSQATSTLDRSEDTLLRDTWNAAAIGKNAAARTTSTTTTKTVGALFSSTLNSNGIATLGHSRIPASSSSITNNNKTRQPPKNLAGQISSLTLRIVFQLLGRYVTRQREQLGNSKVSFGENEKAAVPETAVDKVDVPRPVSPDLFNDLKSDNASIKMSISRNTSTASHLPSPAPSVSSSPLPASTTDFPTQPTPLPVFSPTPFIHPPTNSPHLPLTPTQTLQILNPSLSPLSELRVLTILAQAFAKNPHTPLHALLLLHRLLSLDKVLGADLRSPSKLLLGCLMLTEAQLSDYQTSAKVWARLGGLEGGAKEAVGVKWGVLEGLEWNTGVGVGEYREWIKGCMKGF